ncbi:MAG: AMP-binding protein [Clostridiales bacterium]|nr:AMP-binding protein [Clostridiales bacterium]
MKNKNYPLYHLLPELRSLRELLEQKRDRYPNDIAFRWMEGRKTLREKTCLEFYQDVQRGAACLMRARIQGRHIALMGENSYLWLVAYFAIVLTGNVAVLIAKDAGNLEVVQLMRQSDTDLLIYSPQCEAKATFCKQTFGRKVRCFSLEDAPRALEKGQKYLNRGRYNFEALETDPDALCTIFFTSGSTGFSKGVVLSQTNMVSDINYAVQNFVPGGPTMAVLPFHHAFGLVTSVMMPIHYHVPIFICGNLANFMREVPIAKPQILFLVPLFVETFSKTIWRTAEKQGQAKKLLSGMRLSDALRKVGVDRRRELFDDVLSKFGGNLEYIICGGAPLDPRYVKEFRSLGIEILNGYGITECSPVLAVNRNHWVCDGSVGQVPPGVQIKIDNPDRKGEGEICVDSRVVMLGYYNDPDATAQVMEGPWFHTGDRGYLNKDGFLFITGRKKNLIILSNGENVSPEELEQYVARISEVGEVVVYERDGKITAEVYPEESDLPRQEVARRIQKKLEKMNATLPACKHVQKLVVRETPFEKTATAKIKRYKVGK